MSRYSLYLRPKKDKDIVEYINPLLCHYDFSEIVRDLLRDGIRYRTGQIKVVEPTTYTAPPPPILDSQETFAPKVNSRLKDVKLEKKQVDDTELDSRLDDF